jgi:hypothetical protein
VLYSVDLNLGRQNVHIPQHNNDQCELTQVKTMIMTLKSKADQKTIFPAHALIYVIPGWLPKVYIHNLRERNSLVKEKNGISESLTTGLLKKRTHKVK